MNSVSSVADRLLLMNFGANHRCSLEPSSGTKALRYWLLVGLSLSVGLGCASEQAASDAAPDDSRIKPLTSMYAGYTNRNGNPPASEEEFKRFVAESGEPLLKAAEVNSVEELFVSPRDNEPYVILYGTEAAKLINRGIVMHERTGVGGRRLVGFRMGFVKELDEAEFRKLVPTL